jgi:molecular chaperone GrpE
MEEEKDKEFPADDDAGEQDVTNDPEALRRRLDAKTLEAKENYDRLLRQAADIENYKKRAAREKADSIRYGNESLVRELLPVLDNLERALGYAKEGGDGHPLLEGIELVRKSLLETLSRHGVNPIAALGERFDPAKHEAVAQIESREHDPNTVVEEHQKGYYLADRLLRPARVVVSKAPENKQEKKGRWGG